MATIGNTGFTAEDEREAVPWYVWNDQRKAFVRLETNAETIAKRGIVSLEDAIAAFAKLRFPAR